MSVVTPDPTYDEKEMEGPAGSERVSRWTNRTLMMVLGFGLLVLLLAFMAARQAGVGMFGSTGGGAVVDTTSGSDRSGGLPTGSTSGTGSGVSSSADRAGDGLPAGQNRTGGISGGGTVGGTETGASGSVPGGGATGGSMGGTAQGVPAGGAGTAGGFGGGR